VADASVAAVFFDLGDTLGTAVLGGQPPKLVGFDVFPFVPAVLADLKARGLKLGVISNTGDEKGPAVNAVLAPTGLLANFDPALVVYSGDETPLPNGTPVTKAIPEIFHRAADRAGLGATPERCLFVGDDARERQVAASAGWRVCPHPLLVGEVLDGQALRYVRLTVPPNRLAQPWRTELRKRAFVPQHFAGRRGATVYGLTSDRVAGELGAMGLDVDLLGGPDLPRLSDLYLLHDDVAARSGFLAAQGEAARTFAAAGQSERIVKYLPEGDVVVALPGDVAPDALHFPGTRHGHTLKLTPDPLLWDQPPPTGAPAPPAGFVAGQAALAQNVVAELAQITPAVISDLVGRYSGALPLDGSAAAKVTSRHIRHPDNSRAVAQLVTDLEAAGQGRLQVRLHRFTYTGLQLFNVEAELAGTSPEVVLVTAHLDSTAAFQQPYDPATDPAPGADDDGSGVAAVLAIAQRFAALAAVAPPARTIRFVLFNAEEQGLIGSQAYARRSKSRGESIAAVWQMDMIGYNKAAPLSWEVHTGFEASPAVEARSHMLADWLRAAAPQVSPELPAVQIYHSATAPEGDPAAGRSDHASFQAQGYPACVVSEDFFVGPDADAPAPQENPNYHRPGDTFVAAGYAADITRALAAAAWATASQLPSPADLAPSSFLAMEEPMPALREFDSRKQPARPAALVGAAAFAEPPGATARTNPLTGSPVVVPATRSSSTDGSLVERALAFARNQGAAFGFTAGQPAEFVPDPVIRRTSAGAAAVNLQQQYYGVPVFQMNRTVRFKPDGLVADAAGDTAPMPAGMSTEPKLSAEAGVLKAAEHLASTGAGETVRDQFGQVTPLPTIDIKGFTPNVIARFPLAPRPTVFDKGPFENPIPAHLVVFNQTGAARLAWYVLLTFPNYAQQYAVIVAADTPTGEILYSKSTLRHAGARGRVYEFSPGVADRRMIDFPRQLADFPAMPSSPITGFPADWVDTNQTMGNSTRATLNFTTQTLNGTNQNGVVEFDPAQGDGDDQKLLNIFYFCNYMHDFLYILGFDESNGNFQQLNFTHTGATGDPVLARAHSGPVSGTANMATGPDGLSPVMNMGLVVASNRHTAFDADVVFHEYTHGLTNRMVGDGRMNAPHSLEKLQSGGMGEGWSDYFALTIQNYFRANEKTVTGDWVINNAAGIRRAPYDDAYPYRYGDLMNFPEVHDIGEVWCATLMMMTRKLRAALGNDQQGYRLAWQIVVDALKLTPSNPTFLDARDAILRAIDDLGSTNRIPPSAHGLARKAAWQAFAHFGMGINATSGDADDVDSIIADTTLPPGI
jgi:hypothetical protein